jgi:hypothetical protein
MRSHYWEPTPPLPTVPSWACPRLRSWNRHDRCHRSRMTPPEFCPLGLYIYPVSNINKDLIQSFVIVSGLFLNSTQNSKNGISEILFHISILSSIKNKIPLILFLHPYLCDLFTELRLRDFLFKLCLCKFFLNKGFPRFLLKKSQATKFTTSHKHYESFSYKSFFQSFSLCG